MFSLSFRRFHTLLFSPTLLPLLVFIGSGPVPNSPPVAVDDSYTIHGCALLNPKVTANDADPDNDPIFVGGFPNMPTHGGLSNNGNNNLFYCPNYSYVGADSFTYQLCDPQSACTTATVSLNIVNQPPVGVTDTFNIHGRTIVEHLLANDSDPDGDGVTCGDRGHECILTFPQHGGLSGLAIDRWSYGPAFGYTGPDSFTYNVCDDLGLCTPTTVNLNVNNQPPIAGNDAYMVPDGATTIGPFLVNDSDPDGDAIGSPDIQTFPQHGSLSGTVQPDRKFYNPEFGFNGTDLFTYKICDDLGACATATVTLQVGAAPTPTPTPTPIATPTPPPPPPPPPPSPTPTPTPMEPVIFIPGISGSRLDERLSSGGRKNLWPGFSSLVPLIVSDKSRLTLDPAQPQANIFAPDIIRSVPARVLGMTVTEQDVYGTLIQRLKQNGYREYLVNSDPSRRTAAGCDLSQKSDDPNSNPNLFIFAYDWRQSNADSALALRSYVECIKRFYPDSKVNVLTHSMGGLLARRYIIDNPNGAHNVDKLITVAAPWLGVPKAINVLETGDFGVPEMIVKDDTLKALVKFFKSAHEILPSRFYVSLGGDVFGEKNWDINGDRRVNATYNYDQFVALVDNVRFRESKPGSTNRAFHTAAQDDWRSDNSGVKYFHFYGNQRLAETIGKITAVSRPLCDPTGVKCKPTNEFAKTFVRGDGTVTVLSAERNGNGMNLNAPNALVRAFAGPSRDIEHTALTQNAQVFAAIQSALTSDSQTQAKQSVAGFDIQTRAHHRLRPTNPFLWNDPGQSLEPADPARYLSVWGVDSVVVEDALGNRNDPIPETSSGAQLPEVSYELGLNSVSVITPVDQSYTLSFQSKGEPILVEIVTGVGNETPTQAIRYLDLNLPSGTIAVLRMTPSGVEDLRYDGDGDGVFESALAPTASAVGDSALDVEAPTVAMSEGMNGVDRTITLTAVDDNSGVRVLRYSLDGQTFQPYWAPFHVNSCEVHSVYAFADDLAGNRSELFTFEFSNLAPDLSGARPSLNVLWPPNHKMADMSILGITDPDCDPFTITITRITQDEPNNGSGDGNTCPDGQGLGTPIAKLRAERDGSGNGRVYTIYFIATDNTGRASTGSVKVTVPKDRNKDALNDDIQFDSTQCP